METTYKKVKITGKIFFSIIIPAYNAEKVLQKSLKSILVQTYMHFEVIIVNDGSTDRTGEIAEKYARSDKRVSVINLKRNQGIANARNQGMKASMGTYITFLDADDFVDSNMLQTYYNHVNGSMPDMVKTGLVEEYYDKNNRLKNRHFCRYQGFFVKRQEQIAPYIIDLEMIPVFGYTWNTLYKLNLIKKMHLVFDTKNIMQEDFMFNLSYFKYINSLMMIDFMPYHYIKTMNDNSLSSKYVKEYWPMYHAKVKALCEYYDSVIPDDTCSWDKVRGLYVRYVISAIERNLDKQSGMTIAEIYTWIKTIYEDALFKQLKGYKNVGKLPLRVMAFFLFNKHTYSNIVIAEIIKIIKKYFVIIFSKLK